MIAIHGRLTFAPGQVADAAAAFRVAAAATRTEPGCLDFGVSADIDDPNTLVVFEVFESQEALDTHSATPHLLALGEALSGLDLRSNEGVGYDVSSIRRYDDGASRS